MNGMNRRVMDKINLRLNVKVTSAAYDNMILVYTGKR